MAQKQTYQPSSREITYAVIFICLGVIFSLQQFFDINLWSTIWRFWPLLFFILGVLAITGKLRDNK